MRLRKVGCAIVCISFATVGTTSNARAAAAAAAADAPGDSTLDEIVITATRQNDTIHDVPLDVTAISSVQLDQQGIKEAGDIVQTVTSLRISGANAGGAGGIGGSSGTNAQVSIRGIASSVAGAAPTTGVYIDDVPLQQRTSLAPTGGGVALPLLFDLDRVEVLKGPQGTLYGGSSEGGTLRFITPQPSVTDYSLYTRAEGNGTKGGDGGYEYGISAGGPLVNDVLGAHVSAVIRHDGGYVDHVSQFTGDTIASNTNGSDHIGLHATVLAKFTDRASATVGITFQREHYADSDNFWLNIPQYQANVGPITGPTTYTYGPYNQFGPFHTGANTNIGQNFYTSDAQLSPLYQPHTQIMTVPSLTLDYRFDAFTIKSVTAFNDTQNTDDFPVGYTDITGQGTNVHTPPINATVEGPFNALPGNSPFIANLPVYDATFYTSGRNETLSEELRFASTGADDTRFNWVGGLFFDRTTEPGSGFINSNIQDVTAAIIHGVSQRTPNEIALTLPSTLDEKQYAAYAEGVLKITDSLKATLGVRYTHDEFNFDELVGGALFGFPPGLVVPDASGSVTSSATTPKAGLQYILDPNTNFYVTAAEGFRPGGVNPSLTPVCLAAAAAAGFTDVPKTFGEDKLWSYEGGVKLKGWDGRATLNAAAFWINWKDSQTNINLGCGTLFAENAAKEISRGVDLEGSALLYTGLTATLRAGYTDAYYPDDLRSPSGALLINSGDRVAYTPKVQADLGLQYDFNVFDHKTFVRGDYSYQSAVSLSYSAGTVGYTPDNTSLPGADILNLRAGMYFGKVQLSAYVLNVTNSEDLLFRGGFSVGPGRYNCENVACTAYAKVEEGGLAATYRPRTIGISASYKY